MFIRSIMLICLTHVAFDIALCTFYIKSANEEAVQLLHQWPRHTNEMRMKCVCVFLCEWQRLRMSRIVQVQKAGCCIWIVFRFDSGKVQFSKTRISKCSTFDMTYHMLKRMQPFIALRCRSTLSTSRTLKFRVSLFLSVNSDWLWANRAFQMKFKNWNVNGHSACTLRLWQIQRRNRKMKNVSCRYLFCTQSAGYDMKDKPKKEREWRANGIIKKEDKNSEFESFVLLFVRSTLTNAKSFHFFFHLSVYGKFCSR